MPRQPYIRAVLTTALLLACDRNSSRPSASDARPAPMRDAAVARSPADIPSWPRGVDDAFVLYDLGAKLGSRPEAIHVDDRAVYWSQVEKLFRAPKDGSGTPEQIGVFPSGRPGLYIGSDAEFVYWVDRKLLVRRSKQSGDEQSVALEYDQDGGALATGGGYVYLAIWGCRAITRIDARTLEQDIAYIEVGVPRAGNTSLALAGHSLYCGSWGSIYALERWGAEPKRIVDSARRIEGVVVDGERVYWLDNRSPDPVWIGQASTTGEDPRVFTLGSGSASLSLVHDRTGGRLFHILGSWVVGFSTAAPRFSWFARDWLVRQIAIDDTYLYWPHHVPGTDAQEHGKIIRVPLDQPPVLVVDSMTP